MKLLLIAFFLTFEASAAIYGKDDRLEIFQSPSVIRKQAKSIAAMISIDAIKKTRGGYDYKIVAPLYKDLEFLDSDDWDALEDVIGMDLFSSSIKMCKGVKFYAQPMASECTTFLVASDLLMTAGHCVTEENFCKKFVFVFDYTAEHNYQSEVFVDPKNIYTCSKIQYSGYIDPADDILGSPSKNVSKDFAIIKLSKKVKNRAPLKAISKWSQRDKHPVYTIGTPMGLPLKYSGLGMIVPTSIEKNSFVTNLDTFEGNSGSPIFSGKNGKIIGILVSGAEDFNFIDNTQLKRRSKKNKFVRSGHYMTKTDGEVCSKPAEYDNYDIKIGEFEEGEVGFRIDRVFDSF